MTDFSQITSKLEVVVACGGDDDFFEKIKYAILLSTTREIPTSVRRLSSFDDELIFSYSAIITLKDDLVTKYGEEHISQGLEQAIIQLVGTKSSPLITDQALLCKISNTAVIDAFCELHTLRKDILNDPENVINFWSISRENKELERRFKPSGRALFTH